MTNSASNKKGITPIVAIIILLLITIALAGAAYSYISAYWSSVTGKNIQLTTGYCTGGNTANVIVKNMGTSSVILSDVRVMDTSTGAPIIDPSSGTANWTNIDATQVISSLDPGTSGKFNATCTGYCTYRFIYGGAVGAGSQTIPVAC